jgi:type IV protein arginine methyltransferase
MEAHAHVVCCRGGDVLNVGFGMGIVDSAIQRRAPRTHTIIEAHPDVHRRMLDSGERRARTHNPRNPKA